ncbi:MAG: hypothetical protein HUK26_02695 [Duodenibacillus sp.]|nr:hypothetical protein [Duodenibacillus sp.]
MIACSRTTIAIPPGETVLELPGLRAVPESRFAERMGLAEEDARRLLEGAVRLTPDAARRLEDIFGLPASFWLGLEAVWQRKLSLVIAERRSERSARARGGVRRARRLAGPKFFPRPLARRRE